MEPVGLEPTIASLQDWCLSSLATIPDHLGTPVPSRVVLAECLFARARAYPVIGTVGLEPTAAGL
jgi:hypothetical protein